MADKKYEIKNIVGYDITYISKFLIEFGFDKKDIKGLVDTILKVRRELPTDNASLQKYIKENFSKEEAAVLREKAGGEVDEIINELFQIQMENYSDLFSELLFKVITGIAYNADKIYELLSNFYLDLTEDDFYNTLAPEEMVGLIIQLFKSKEFMGFFKPIFN